ncbi:MAG: hypothetical protein ACRDPR_20680, partial [Nocardioidaceae bacterium]
MSAFTVTVQLLAVPAQPPLQPANAEPLNVVATSVTGVPLSTLAAHDAPQSIVGAALVTFPLPLPRLPTVSLGLGTAPPAVSSREAPPPFELKAAVPVTGPATVGVKRTTTAVLAPGDS